MATRADVLRLTVEVENKEALARLKKVEGVAVKANTNVGKSAKKAAAGTATATKSFTAMRASLLGPVGVIAGLGYTANKLIQVGEQATLLDRGFQTLNKRIGQDSVQMLEGMRRATLGLVSDMELMRLTNNAIILGLPITSKRMETLSAGAIKLGRAMGVDATRAMESLITGIGRQSRLMLDNIGLLVSTEQAYRDYARSLGKTSSQLTDTERKMAFFIAAEQQVVDKTKDLQEEAVTLGQIWNSTWTGMVNVAQKSAKEINEIPSRLEAIAKTGAFSVPLGTAGLVISEEEAFQFKQNAEDLFDDPQFQIQLDPTFRLPPGPLSPDGIDPNIPPLSGGELGALPPKQLTPAEIRAFMQIEEKLAAERELQMMLIEIQMAGLAEGSDVQMALQAQHQELERAMFTEYWMSLGIEEAQIKALFRAEDIAAQQQHAQDTIDIAQQVSDDLWAIAEAQFDREIALKRQMTDAALAMASAAFGEDKKVKVAIATADMILAGIRAFKDHDYPRSLAVAAAVMGKASALITVLKSTEPGSAPSSIGIGGGGIPAAAGQPTQNITVFIDNDLATSARVISEYIDVESAVIGQSDG